VALLCRSPERGLEAAASIRRRTGNAGVSFEHVDLADLDSIRDAAARLGDAPIDVLVHNAGVLPDERIETREGFELTLATHVIGPFLLTRLLRRRLEASDDGRVVWVSSGGMYTRRLELDDPSWRRRVYDGVRAYAETKRAQVVLARMWADELREAGVAVYAMHPGWADTPAVRSSLPRFHRLTRPILRTPAEGADTVVWLAASARGGRHSGDFFFDRKPRSAHLLPWTREADADRRALWSACEQWIEATPSPSGSVAASGQGERREPARVATGLGFGTVVSAGRRRDREVASRTRVGSE
jgi:NAD(P)-dependent dehydrogenase (short-subunit alcohol dehydrogenase family)